MPASPLGATATATATPQSTDPVYAPASTLGNSGARLVSTWFCFKEVRRDDGYQQRARLRSCKN